MTQRWINAGTAIMTSAALLVVEHSQAGPEPPEERSRIVELSTPRMETMIDVGGRKLHCFEYGKGWPTVVLVSGLESPQEYWDSVIPGLAARTTVVTYDRAGIGKSEIGDLPTHGEQSAKDLRVLLEKMNVPKPYILVGHSYGGSVARLFASMYPDDMGGLVLEETQHEDVLDEMRKILKGKDLETFEQVLLARFDAPENPRTEADYRNVTREQLKKSRPLPRIPFVILTCADRVKSMQPMFSDEAIEALAKLDSALMNQLAASVPGGRQILVEGTGHNIHVDRPGALIAPVVEMITKVKENKRNGHSIIDSRRRGFVFASSQTRRSTSNVPQRKSRKLGAFVQISLDGYYCDPRGDMSFAHRPPEDAEWREFVIGNASPGGTLLFGRTTYEMMAAWWPTPMAAQSMPEVAARMNAMPKIVFSRTLSSANWSNATLMKDDLVGTVRRMKDQTGPEMTILGSGSIVSQLADAGFIDMFQVVVNPVALGDGKSLFSGLTGPLELTLTNTRVFGNGSVVLWYAPRRPAGTV